MVKQVRSRKEITMARNFANEHDVVDYMEGSTSEQDWNNRCDTVKDANGGLYPPFWYSAIVDRKSTRLNSSHTDISRMPSSA